MTFHSLKQAIKWNFLHLSQAVPTKNIHSETKLLTNYSPLVMLDKLPFFKTNKNISTFLRHLIHIPHEKESHINPCIIPAAWAIGRKAIVEWCRIVLTGPARRKWYFWRKCRYPCHTGRLAAPLSFPVRETVTLMECLHQLETPDHKAWERVKRF